MENVTERIWRENDRVRHFKGNEYIIVGLAAEATNNGDELKVKVVYKRADGTGGLWVRDIEEFNSEVDHEKYPDVTQKYRFELIKE